MTEKEFVEAYKEKAFKLAQKLSGIIAAEDVKLHMALYSLMVTICASIDSNLSDKQRKNDTLEMVKVTLEGIANEIWKKKN